MSVYPREFVFILAESVRQELGGKLTLIGVFSNANVVVPHGTAFPVHLALGLFISFVDGDGKFKANMRLYDPQGDDMGGDFSLGEITKRQDDAMNLILNFPMIPLVAAGRYRVTIHLDDRAYETGFNVRVGPAS